MRYLVLGAVLIAAIAGFIVYSGKDDKDLAQPQGQQIDIEEAQNARVNKAPDFSLQDYDGKKVRLSDFAGQNLIVNSWAVWCPFCVEELKDFAELKRDLGDAITIIAINRAESLERAKGFSDQYDLNRDITFLLDPKDSFYRSIGGFSMPETIFVNGQGELIFHKRGPMPIEEMRAKAKEFFGI